MVSLAEALGCMIEKDALLSGVSRSQGLNWAQIVSYTCEVGVLYDGDAYKGIIVRRIGAAEWNAIPYDLENPSRVRFTGDLFETMAWMEDRAKQT